MAVAQLEADGRISLDDDVRKYLPELPDFGARITLRHLVHHTSGIRDWPGTLALGGWLFEDVMTFGQILQMAVNQKDLNFAPGSTHVYSNTGYNILAAVVARVSGKSFRAFCDERIFAPLGMSSTHFHDDHTEIVPNRAESYRIGPDGRPRHVTSNLTALGSSSLFTTILDLAKWINHLHSPSEKLGGQKVVTRLHEQGKLNSGETIAYAWGQSIGEYRGARMVSHTGSWAGYRSILQRFPDQKFAVVILANHASVNTTILARQIVDIQLADRLGPAATPAPGPTPAGRGNAPAAAWKPTEAELASYAGEYRSAELKTSYVLEVREGQLIARHFRTGDFPFRPVDRDRFQAPTFGEVRFLRDAAGAIVAFTSTSDRVRNLRFDRVPKQP
jgi:CubicO group peptidase (beta-lactamase class C family)